MILHSSRKNTFIVHCGLKNWWPCYYRRHILYEETSGRHISKDKKVSFKINKFLHYSRFSIKGQSSLYWWSTLSIIFSLRKLDLSNLILPLSKIYPDRHVVINKKKCQLMKCEKLLLYPKRMATIDRDVPEVEHCQV